MTARLADLVAPHALRRVAPPDSPFAGRIVAGDPPRLWVELADFADSAAWRADPDGHLLAPIDVAHTEAGHAVVLPVCSVRLEHVLPEIASAGAAVTAAVSLLRGAADADELGADAGIWWVSDAARPVLALTGSLPWRPATVDALRALGEQVPVLADTLERAATAVGDARRLRRDLVSCEEALFRIADPAPLPDVRVASAPPRVGAPPRAPRVKSRRESTVREPGLLSTWAATVMDAGLLQRVRASVPRPARRMPRAPSPTDREGAQVRQKNRTPWVVAAAVGMIIVMVGVFWPVEGDAAPPSPSRAAVPPATTAPSAAATAAPSPTPTPLSLDEVGTALVSALSSCASECVIRENPTLGKSEGAASVAGAEVSVVDDYGGVAVFRAEAEGAATEMIVAVRSDDQWLVREVYQLATDVP